MQATYSAVWLAQSGGILEGVAVEGDAKVYLGRSGSLAEIPRYGGVCAEAGAGATVDVRLVVRLSKS